MLHAVWDLRLTLHTLKAITMTHASLFLISSFMMVFCKSVIGGVGLNTNVATVMKGESFQSAKFPTAELHFDVKYLKTR
jgi:hypothetical protein